MSTKIKVLFLPSMTLQGWITAHSISNIYICEINIDVNVHRVYSKVLSSRQHFFLRKAFHITALQKQITFCPHSILSAVLIILCILDKDRGDILYLMRN